MYTICLDTHVGYSVYCFHSKPIFCNVVRNVAYGNKFLGNNWMRKRFIHTIHGVLFHSLFEQTHTLLEQLAYNGTQSLVDFKVRRQDVVGL